MNSKNLISFDNLVHRVQQLLDVYALKIHIPNPIEVA